MTAEAQDLLGGDVTEWGLPPPIFMCNTTDLDPNRVIGCDDECDCGYRGRWLRRQWRHDLAQGFDEKCPQCGDVERWTATDGDWTLTAEISNTGVACPRCGHAHAEKEDA